MVGRALARSLSDEHDVQVCDDGKDALERITRGERYDVILCDLMMPDITGIDFYREVLRLAPEVAARIVFMTGGVYTPRMRAFVQALPNRCIEKPPDSAKLREIVRRHVP
jgi:CheY-like chemotaxis protein